MLFWLVNLIVVLFLGLGSVAFMTLMERKILGLSQIRLGPNKTSFVGILQPVLDGLKLLLKKFYLISFSQLILFLMSPFLLFFLFSISWMTVLAWQGTMVLFKYTSLLYFSLLSLGSYAVILTGWGQTSSFSKLGGLRGMLQALSFEVTLILVVFFILGCKKTMSFQMEVKLTFELISIWILFWMLLSLLETNRAPFDLLEGESELISGFNVEMSSISFVFLFLSEYGIIILMSILFSIICFNKMVTFFFISFSCFLLFMRSCFPRVRYDILMSFMWKKKLPLILILIFIISFFF